MTLKDPALLRTGNDVSFLDYWFMKTGNGEGYRDNGDGSFSIHMGSVKFGGLPMSAITLFPKSVRGLCGIMDEFETWESSLHQVGLRDLAEYIKGHDEYFKVKMEDLPDVLARDWKKYAGEIVKL